LPWADVAAPGACGLGGAGGGLGAPPVDPTPWGAPDRMLLVAFFVLGLGLVGAVFLGTLKMGFVRRYPQHVVGLMVFCQCALPIVTGAALAGASAAGQAALLGPGIGLMVVGVFGGILIVLWRRRVVKAAHLLALTAQSVKSNRAVLTASFLFQMAAVMLSALVVTLTCLALAASSHLVRNPDILPGAEAVQGDHCVGHPTVCDGAPGSKGRECHEDPSQLVTLPCCAARVGGLGISYAVFSLLFMFWGTSLLFTLKQFTISGTVAQWYFSPVGSSTSGNLMRSLRHGLGPQIGTLAFAAAVKNALDTVRSFARRSRPHDGAFNVLSVLYCLFRAFIEMAAELLEVLTDYAVVYSSMSGQALVDSGRYVAQIGRRHFGDALAMWAFPGTMLGALVLFLALVWTSVMGVTTWLLCVGDPRQGAATGAMSAGVFSISYVILSFFSGVLLDSTKAVFVCYVLDKDQHQICRSDVHEAFSAVPLGKYGKGAGGGEYP